MNTTLAPKQSLVALTPAELPAVQHDLIAWCGQKMRELGKEYKDLSENLAIAKKAKWQTVGWKRAVAKSKARIQYYQKIRIAVKEGYLIIPNLSAEIMAVRVEQASPRTKEGTYPSQVIEAKAQLLGPDRGRYVDESLIVHSGTRPTGKKHSDGTPATERWARAEEYNETPDFPAIMVKPILLDATHRAMALHVFDRIGIINGNTGGSLKARRSDPIVVGQILDPRSTTWQPRLVTFFIAWWLNTEML